MFFSLVTFVSMSICYNSVVHAADVEAIPPVVSKDCCCGRRCRSFALVIDDTGSMFSTLSWVQSAMATYLPSFAAGNNVINYILIRVNDPTVGATYLTTNQAGFFNALNAVTAGGGGDCPELMWQGMDQAAQESLRHSFILGITDADPKDAATYWAPFNAAVTAKADWWRLIQNGRCWSGPIVDPGPTHPGTTIDVKDAKCVLSSPAADKGIFTGAANTAKEAKEGAVAFACPTTDGGRSRRQSSAVLQSNAYGSHVLIDGTQDAMTKAIVDALAFFDRNEGC